jgi:hypothetical protein
VSEESIENLLDDNDFDDAMVGCEDAADGKDENRAAI